MRVNFIALFVLLSLFAFAGCSSNDGTELAGPISAEIDDVASPNDYDEDWGEEDPDGYIGNREDNGDEDDEWSDEEEEDVDFEGESDAEEDDSDLN